MKVRYSKKRRKTGIGEKGQAGILICSEKRDRE
jgi:hypothetical protein